jgi:benzoyl-CoA-dihydrodiol lyase
MDRIQFETEPDRYRHWRLTFDGGVCHLAMDVQEDAPLRPGYVLKLNSYDLGVDIELADALQRIRFEHPEVGALVMTSAKERVFSAGANIPMLATSSHPFKVNFCKYTNETRLYLEELAETTGVHTLCAIRGICAGGGYELALACERILLVDDGNSAVALPETPLLGVLPGTGGLTRVVDKRKVRRDRADVFATKAEGIKGVRAAEWKLVDRVVPRSRFTEEWRAEAEVLAAQSRRLTSGLPVRLQPLQGLYEPDRIEHRYVSVVIDQAARTATINVQGPSPEEPIPDWDGTPSCDVWPLRAFRELDDVLLHLRFDHEEIGLLVIQTRGDPDAVLRMDRSLAGACPTSGFAREVMLQIRRTIKRLDLTARSLFALASQGSCFAGSLLELALAADRFYVLNDPEEPVRVGISPLNLRAEASGGASAAGGKLPWLPMSSGLTRLETRFRGEPERFDLLHDGLVGAEEAQECGLATFAPDPIDWEDEVRVAIEERASLSPDALTGMEASLRFPGPETMETKIFARLSAWQNWIFTRPNSTGEKGALTLYGRPERPEFDWRRT